MGYNWSGSLDNENSSASVNIVFSSGGTRAEDGDVFGTTMKFDKSFKHNAGTIRVVATNINVSDRDGTETIQTNTIGKITVGNSTQTLENNGAVSFDINYYMGTVNIVFTCSLNGDWTIYGGTITAYWSGIDQSCSYSFKTASLQFNGGSQTILSSYDTTHLTATGQNATNAGNYTCTLTVKDQYKALWCLRNSSGEMTDSISKDWSIEKITPEFTIADETININKETAANIKGTFPGYSNYSIRPLGSSVISVLGYDDRDGAPKLRLKGTEAGTCNITVYSTSTTNYYQGNYTFSATVIDNRSSQGWYYSNTSVIVGSTVTISRQGSGISSKTASLTIGNSSIISAKIYSDGSINITGLKAGTSTLTVSIDEDDNYKYKSDTITVIVNNKAEQTWEALDIDDLIYNEVRQITITGTYYGTLSYDSYDRDIITLNTSDIPAKIRAEKVGSTTLRIIASGDDAHQARDYTISITVGKKEQNVTIPNIELSVGQSSYLYYEHGYEPASGNPTFEIASGNDYISINNEIPPKVTAKAVGTAIIYFSDAGNEYYFPVKNSPIYVTVTSDTRGEQDWAFSSPQDIELGQTIEVMHNGGTIWGEVSVGVEDVTLLEASYDSSIAKLTITANNTISGKTSVRIEAAGNAYFKPHYQDIEININKHKQAWTLNPSEVTIEIGESKDIKIKGEMFGSANTYVAPAKIYMNVEPHFGETPPYFTVTGKQTINRGQLTVSSTESTTYEDRSQTAYITVGDKKDQTWEANISEATIKISEFIDISVFGTIYGGLYFSTESSLITITNKTEAGCRIVAGNSTGTATVRLYSPGTTAYNRKEEYITIYIKDDLMWVKCNPHIYKNGKWIELSPKIYKNGRWLSGIIKKYISKGDIYGK